MTTFTIDNPVLEEKYTAYEIKRKFLYFIQTELKEESINLYEISLSDIPNKVLKTHDDFENINFIKR
jgi:hypothetical protein